MNAPTLTLDQVRRMLPTQKHRLDDELEIHADIQERISLQVTVHNSRVLETKDELAKLESRLIDDLKDGERISNEVAAGRVKRDPERVRAWQRYQAARAEHEAWLGVYEAWRSKGYGMKTLADLYMAQYFNVNDRSMSDTQRERLEQGDDRRAAIRRAGHRSALADPTTGIPAGHEGNEPRSGRRTLI